MAVFRISIAPYQEIVGMDSNDECWTYIDEKVNIRDKGLVTIHEFSESELAVLLQPATNSTNAETLATPSVATISSDSINSASAHEVPAIPSASPTVSDNSNPISVAADSLNAKGKGKSSAGAEGAATSPNPLLSS